jgi:hypothetical protein
MGNRGWRLRPFAAIRGRMAFDGDRQTRWASAQAGDRPAWLEVDFGRETAVGELVIHWERAAAQRTRSVSRPIARHGRPIHRQPDGAGGTERITGLDGTRALSADPVPAAGVLGLVFHLGGGVSRGRSGRGVGGTPPPRGTVAGRAGAGGSRSIGRRAGRARGRGDRVGRPPAGQGRALVRELQLLRRGRPAADLRRRRAAEPPERAERARSST